MMAMSHIQNTGTCAACNDGTRYADHVAGSDTGGGGDHKRLKRGNGFPVLSFFRDDANRSPNRRNWIKPVFMVK